MEVKPATALEAPALKRQPLPGGLSPKSRSRGGPETGETLAPVCIYGVYGVYGVMEYMEYLSIYLSTYLVYVCVYIYIHILYLQSHITPIFGIIKDHSRISR